MTVVNIVLTVFFILLLLVAIMMFTAISWSLFEDTNVGEAISEWIISKFKKGEDEE